MTTLTIRALGAAEALLDHAPVHWPSQGARELFFYLLSNPDGRSRDHILEDLWDLEPDAAAANRFRVTVHRLRTALGGTDALEEDHGRYRLNARVLRGSDVHAFLAASAEAERAPDRAARLEACRAAVAAYRGDYLPLETAEWAARAREEYRAAYVRATVELSLMCCDDEDCAGAVGALARSLRADPFAGENLHQKLMTCLAVVEGKYAAIEHYRRFLKFLRDEIEDEPMPETVDLAARIKADEAACPRHLPPRLWGAAADAPATLNCPLSDACHAAPAAGSGFLASAAGD
jgi:two-component SAPR family response regulator